MESTGEDEAGVTVVILPVRPVSSGFPVAATSQLGSSTVPSDNADARKSRKDKEKTNMKLAVVNEYNPWQFADGPKQAEQWQMVLARLQECGVIKNGPNELHNLRTLVNRLMGEYKKVFEVKQTGTEEPEMDEQARLLCDIHLHMQAKPAKPKSKKAEKRAAVDARLSVLPFGMKSGTTHRDLDAVISVPEGSDVDDDVQFATAHEPVDTVEELADKAFEEALHVPRTNGDKTGPSETSSVTTQSSETSSGRKAYRENPSPKRQVKKLCSPSRRVAEGRGRLNVMQASFSKMADSMSSSREDTERRLDLEREEKEKDRAAAKEAREEEREEREKQREFQRETRREEQDSRQKLEEEKTKRYTTMLELYLKSQKKD